MCGASLSYQGTEHHQNTHIGHDAFRRLAACTVRVLVRHILVLYLTLHRSYTQMFPLLFLI